MTVKILNFSEDLNRRFASEKVRLISVLGTDFKIEHVGSSAVGIGGKNIIDILIGVPDQEAMARTRDTLIKNGYFSGNDNHDDRAFLASRIEETGENDIHIHICPIDSDTFRDFLVLRDYLREHPAIAKTYFDKKKEIAISTQNNRREYKKLKSQYVSQLLKAAKQEK